jgi:hypothetical protein
MEDEPQARIPEQTAMDVLDRVLRVQGDDLDRITIMAMRKGGRVMEMYSNARSEAEMFGMLHMGLCNSEDMSDE